MRGAHEDDAIGASEYAPKMSFGVISREQNGLLANKAAQAVSDKNEGRDDALQQALSVVKSFRRFVA